MVTSIEQTIINKTEKADSITISTPSKGGEIKVYFDASKPEEAQALIENAIKLRTFANEKINQ